MAGHLLLLPAFLHMNMMRAAAHYSYFNLQMSSQVSTDAAFKAAVNRPMWPVTPHPLMSCIPSNLSLLSFFVVLRAAVITNMRW